MGASAVASSTALGPGDPFIDHTADKLMTPDLSTAWRSGSLAALAAEKDAPERLVSVLIDLGTARSVNWVSIHRHNVRTPWRADLYKGDPALGAAPVFSSPWTDPIIRAAVRDFSFSDLVFTLGPTQRQLARWTSLFRLDSFIPTDRVYYNVRWIKLTFDGSPGVNGEADYFQVAYPVAGRTFRPEINMVLGHKITPTDRSDTRRTESGAKRGRKRSHGRTFFFDLGYLELREAYSRILLDWLDEHGTLDLVFVWGQPAHRRHFYATALLGQLSELPSVSMPNLEWPDARGFAVEEAE
jgi:hypothetical protein